MLLRGLKLTLIGAAGTVLAAGAGLADNHKFGLEYRAGLTYDDGKIAETEGVDAEDAATSEISTEAIKVTATGEAAKDVNYTFRYDALNSEVEHANARLQFNNMMGFTVGRTKVNQGGWHAKDNWMEYHDTEDEFGFAYADAQAFDAFDDVISLHLALAGELTVQLLDDVMQEDVDGDGTVDNVFKNKSNKGPAATIEWVGNFNGWMPLVQIVSYDLNNSQAFSVGVKGKAAGLGISLGYNVDNRKNFSGADEETDTRTGIDAHFDYAVGTWTPWLAYHSYDYANGDSDVDADFNAETDTLNDNAQQIAVGVHCNAMGDGYVPYASILSNSGKFNDGSDKEESRSGMALKVGVMGKF